MRFVVTSSPQEDLEYAGSFVRPAVIIVSFLRFSFLLASPALLPCSR